MSKIYTIRDHKSNQWSSVCIITGVKFILIAIVITGLNYQMINFKSFYYAINLDVVSLFVGFNDFDYIFISMYY